MGAVRSNRIHQVDHCRKVGIPWQYCSFAIGGDEHLILKIDLCTCRHDFKMGGTTWCSDHVQRHKSRNIDRQRTSRPVDHRGERRVNGRTEFAVDVEIKSGQQFGLAIDHVAKSTWVYRVFLEHADHFLCQPAYHPRI